MSNIFKKHFETFQILGGMLAISIAACFWLNSRFSAIEKDVAIIKTILIMQGVMPKELAHHQVQHTPSTPPCSGENPS